MYWELQLVQGFAPQSLKGSTIASRISVAGGDLKRPGIHLCLQFDTVRCEWKRSGCHPHGEEERLTEIQGQRTRSAVKCLLQAIVIARMFRLGERG
jgi:hypothetical protein